jgi:flagellar hook-associated protein 1
MSGISSILNIATSGLFAAQTGIEVTSHNVANANTDGYMRQTPVYSASEPVSGLYGLLLGPGVSVSDIRTAEDKYLDAQVNRNTAVLGQYSLASEGTSQLEELVNESTSDGLSAALSDYFAALQDLAANPTGTIERTALQGKAQILVQKFHSIATGIQDVRLAMNDEIGGDVKEVNSLAAKIADLNGKITDAEASGQSAADFRSSRGAMMTRLAQLVGFHSSENSRGAVTIYISGGLPLVSGTTAATLATTDDATNDNLSSIQFVDSRGNQTDVTDQIGSGRIQGALDVRDDVARGMMSNLDGLAYELTTQVNAIHSAAYGANGSTGINFFADLGGTTSGAASRIALDPSILADVNNIAAGMSSDTGDNTAALSMAGLETALVMNGGTQTFTDYYSSIIGNAGTAAQSASDSNDYQQAVTDQLATYRESITGVSIDEEMTNLLKYQQAYQASAKMVTSVQDILDTLMKM